MDSIKRKSAKNERTGRLRMRIGLRIMVCILATLVLLSPAQAAVFNIAAGDVSALINAINTANGNNEDDTINLAAGTYTLTAVDNETDVPNGLPLITSTISIHGTGANRTVLARAASAPEFFIVHVAATGVLTLDGLTLTGGILGGIRNAGGRVTLLNSSVSNTFSSNEAFLGIENFEGTLTLLNSSVSNISSNIAAVAIQNNAGTLTLLNSSVNRNFGAGDVGGILNIRGGIMTLVNSSVNDNFGTGAGISNGEGGEVTLTNTTVSGNGSRSEGTAGIENEGGTLTLANSTVSNNSSSFGVGGILSENGGTVEMTNTIVAGNSISGGVTGVDCSNGPLFSTSPGKFISRGHNLVGSGTGCPSDGPGDLTVDPAKVFTTVLGPLQNNGGPTETHALLPGSPAIDAGSAVCTDANGAPLTTDQRGKPRPVDGNGDGIRACDIGAFEFFPTVNNLVTLAPGLQTSFNTTPVLGGPAGTFTIKATFTNTSSTPLHALFFGVSQLTGGNLLLNADSGPGGVGATLTPKISGDVLALGGSVTVEFIVGLQKRGPFTFFVNVFAEPVL